MYYTEDGEKLPIPGTQVSDNFQNKSMRYIVPFFLLLSCQSLPESGQALNATPDSLVAESAAETLTEDTTKRTAHFVDSTTIGKKSFNKVELAIYKRTEDEHSVNIKFYSKKGNSWVIKSAFESEISNLIQPDVKVSDFNNDGMSDVTYISALAARGANEVRSLFIYDSKKDDLVFIKNSEDYPNILYNKELNCIDAWLVYGGYSTVFLKLQGDSLKEFASVQTFEGITVKTFDKNGKEKIIFHDDNIPEDFIRYKNFKPLKVNENW